MRGWASELTCLRDCTLVNAGGCSVGGDGPASRDDGNRRAGGAQRHRSWYPGGSGEHLVDDDTKSGQVWGKGRERVRSRDKLSRDGPKSENYSLSQHCRETAQSFWV